MAVSADVMRAYQGTDVWGGCSGLVEDSLVPRSISLQYLSAGCEDPHPEGKCPNLGELGFCRLNPTHPWCSNPCCNREKAETMCCVAKTYTRDLQAPTVDGAAFGNRCPGANTADKTTSVLTAADAYAATLAGAKDCLPSKADVSDMSSTLDKAADCCFYVVVGSEERGDMQTVKSAQLCNSHDECDSGECVITTNTAAVTVPSYASSCYASGAAEIQNKLYFCKLPVGDAQGPALGNCFKRRFAASDKLPTAFFRMKEAFGLQYDASEADTGKAIFDNTKWSYCDGDEGWYYDVHNPEKRCNDVADCQTKCVEGSGKCNWMGGGAGGEVTWDGNGLAYPRIGYVSDRCQTGVRPVSPPPCTVHVTVPLLPHAQSMSPCHVRCTVMSDAQSCRMHSVSSPMHSLDRIFQESNLKVWSDVSRETGPLISLACTVSSSGDRGAVRRPEQFRSALGLVLRQIRVGSHEQDRREVAVQGRYQAPPLPLPRARGLREGAALRHV